MTKQNFNYLGLVVDRSGSMDVNGAYIEATGGINSLLEDNKQFVNTRVMVVAFDHEVEVRVEDILIGEVPPFEPSDFHPRGTTALVDAIGFTVDRLGQKFAAMPEHERPSKVIVGIVTDGFENASRKYTLPQVQAKLREQIDVYNWDIQFLAASLDVVKEWDNYTVSAQTYNNTTPGGTTVAYRVFSSTVTKTLMDSSV